MSAGRAPPATTGLPALDRVVHGLRPGDGVVWQVDSVDDYVPFVDPFVARALATARRLVYFRFARHAPLVRQERGAEIRRLSPAVGFESFTAEIHRAIEESGPGAFYVFDCLSDLATDWCSDLMLGNFFVVTCPYLHDLDAVAYFALLRDGHSHEAVDPIRNTTRLLVDVFRRAGTFYVHPLKVSGRQSPTMYLPHAMEGDAWRPLTESAVLSEVLAELADRRLDAVARRHDPWDDEIQRAEDALAAERAGAATDPASRELFEQLVGMMLTRDGRMAELARRWLDLPALLDIRRRMIGTGLIGGKALGLLLARAILARELPSLEARLEPHDSWFIGSNVFYTYLVRNGGWRARLAQRSPVSFLDGAADARSRILGGAFPDLVLTQLATMLEHYGQSPIIVRSSSALEDGFGNAFTGKYTSVFCANQGAPAERLQALLAAVRVVYASAMSEEVLRYRERRGLLDRDEQMAILVQRVSGAVRGSLFFPQVAGVAFSYNPWVWSREIDPRAGVARVVFGLGTRAVERAEDDHARLVALNAPGRRPETTLDELSEHAQRRVDVVDLETNQVMSLPFEEVSRRAPGLPLELFATPRRNGPPVLTFERLLSATSFVEELRDVLRTLAAAYGHPVDVEFTLNLLAGGRLRLNLVQCRPLQIKEGGTIVPPPPDLPDAAVLLESKGPVVGQSTHAPVDRVILVDHDAYQRLAAQDRYEVARVIGRLTRLEPAGRRRILLLGPGRWGTNNVSLGVPVTSAEIQRVSAICEVVKTRTTVVPDVSLGSHFFNDLVEANMLYVAVYPDLPGYRLAEGVLGSERNRLADLLPDDARMAEIVRVVDFPLPGDGRSLWLNARCIDQRVLCYLASPPANVRPTFAE